MMRRQYSHSSRGLLTGLTIFSLLVIEVDAQPRPVTYPAHQNIAPSLSVESSLFAAPDPSFKLPAAVIANSAAAPSKDNEEDNDAKAPPVVNKTSNRVSLRSLPSLQPLSLPDAAKLTPLDQAYLDVYSILREENECSRFYGGPAAIEVLNQLAKQLKPSYFNRFIALRMKGKIAYAMNNATKLQYRIFEKAELNHNGPFYKSNIFPLDSTVPRVGEFSPNTREARITIMLHEIGHMIQRADGQWVLPNDGDDSEISKENTQKVIDVCREQIRERGHITFEHALASMRADREANAAEMSASVESHATINVDAKPATPDLLRQIGSQIETRCESCRREIQNPQDH